MGNKNLSINIDKTKVMVFNTTQAWVTRSKPEFFLGEKKVAYTCSFTHLGVAFVGPRFSLTLLVLNILIDMQPRCSGKTICTFVGPRATN